MIRRTRGRIRTVLILSLAVAVSMGAAHAAAIGGEAADADHGQAAPPDRWDGAGTTRTTTDPSPLLTCGDPAGIPTKVADGTDVVLRAYDRSEQLLTWSRFRQLQEAGHGSDGDNDVLLDPATLAVRTMWPLQSMPDGNGSPGFAWSGGPVTLGLAWPTAGGYMNLLVDVDAPGTYLFHTLAATQQVRALNGALTARPQLVASEDLVTACDRVRRSLDATAGAPSEARRESEAAATLDAVSAAWSTLLRDYGVQQAGAARERRPLQWGVTFDTTTDLDQLARGYVDLLGAGSSDGWVRLVFDGSEPAASYRDAVRVVHANGLKVNGLLLDSSEMGELSLDAFTARTQEYVDGLPEVDQWEIGNEVNGEWLGSDVVPKISSAAAYVKARGKPTLLTLYWQLGEGDEEHSMFTWAARNLGPELLADIDVLGLSVYPEDHPMGPATFDRVLETLHARYPDKRLAVTELGYWSEDLGHQWWYGSATDPTGEGRRAVARLYQSAILGYPYSAGGAYWWYYAEEAPPGSALWTELRSIRREAS